MEGGMGLRVRGVKYVKYEKLKSQISLGRVDRDTAETKGVGDWTTPEKTTSQRGSKALRAAL